MMYHAEMVHKVYPRTFHEGPEERYTHTRSLTSRARARARVCVCVCGWVGGWSTPGLGHFIPGKDPVPIV